MDDFSASSTVVAPGEVVTLTVEAHDPDCAGTCTTGCGLYVRADLTDWTATGGAYVAEDNGASGSPYTATADWQAPEGEETYTLTVQLSDSGSFFCGGRQTTTASLDVLVTTSTNQPPVVDSLTASPAQLFPGETSVLACSASDPEGDPVTYAWETDHGTVTPGAGGSATFAAGDPGIATVECTATDPQGAFATDSIQLSVSGAEAEKVLAASLITPQRLAVDSRSDVYVVDRNAGGLVVIHLFSGELVYRLPLQGLSSVAVDWNEDLLLGGIGGAEVRDRRGGSILSLNPGQILGRVADVAVDSVNRLWGVLYAGPGRVVIFNEAGSVVQAFGSIGDGSDQFKSPQGLAVTPAGEWVVADGGHGRIKVFDSGGALLRSFGGLGGGAGEFIRLDDVAVDGDGLVYASDSYQSWIQVFNPDGSLREVLGTYGEEPGQFKTPAGVMPVPPFDRLLAASLNGSSVQVFVTSADPVASGPAPVAERSPASLDFADQAVRTESAPQTVTLSNTGDAPLGVRGLAVDGDFAATHDCGPFVEPGTSCSVQVSFAPAAPGPHSGSLTIDTSAEDGLLVVDLAGSAFAPPGVSLSKYVLVFGDQVIGTFSDSREVVLSNTGTVPLAIADIIAGGEFAQSNDCPASLAGGASCSIWVQFTPITIADVIFGSVTVLSDAVDSPHVIELQGTGVAGPFVLTIGDVTIEEGDSGSVEVLFPVLLGSPSDGQVSVDYATADETAAAGDDYQAVAGTILFEAGETERSVAVPVLGDPILEPDEETFLVELSNPANAVIDDGLAVGTIRDDELCLGPNLLANSGAEGRTDLGEIAGWTNLAGGGWSRRFADPAPHEGRAYFFAGATALAELVQEVDVSAYAEAITAGTQLFAFDGVVQTAGDDLARIVVEYRDALNSVVLDVFDSGELSSAGVWQEVGDERLAPAGTGWIRVRLLATRFEEEGDNDAYFDALSLRSVRSAALSIDRLWAYEGDEGVSASDFVVRLACPFHQEVSFDYATADGSATEGVDYLATTGSAVIAVGDSALSVPVSIVGDLEDEMHESLLLTVTLTSPAEAVLVAGSEIGTIVNDDACARGAGYWRRPAWRPGGGWPVTWLLIGGVEYEAAELRQFLGGGGPDATLRLTRQLVAAKLNLARGSDPWILPTVDAADEFLAVHPPGSGLGGDSDAGQLAEILTAQLEAYNEGGCP